MKILTVAFMLLFKCFVLTKSYICVHIWNKISSSLKNVSIVDIKVENWGALLTIKVWLGLCWFSVTWSQ